MAGSKKVFEKLEATMRKEAIKLILEISQNVNAFDILEDSFSRTSKKRLSENIIECGILPEMFEHDSSEEKLWAKYSDIILALSLRHLGIPSEVLRTRGNSADVFGRTKNYSIVGDAKTFRLSRTAKNQKDFKVKALDDWRKHNNYAVLIAPLTQYPRRKSQIYAQAIDSNVTLISYTHLNFLLDFHDKQDLRLLWETGKRLKTTLKPSEYRSSQLYWKEIDKMVCEIVNQKIEILKRYKVLEINKIKEIGFEGIRFWESKIREYQKLTKEEAIKKLISAEKIETKIKIIEKAISQEVEV